MRVRVRAVSVEGRCAAGYKSGDEFYLEKFLLESEKPVCIHAILAVSHVAYALAHGMDADAFGKKEIHLSCPDPGEPHGDGRVTFRIEVVE
ncbi:TIGR04076 family protein [Geoglobus acetivorans]|uniref:TIGR04076 family protein n=1 Tax=Geoglobus acetivorans TaxID=565033 RepID=A0A0A7GDR0_GEOAI|nr:hypothetical protein GACE_1115 [Geoglobus acetivorans]